MSRRFLVARVEKRTRLTDGIARLWVDESDLRLCFFDRLKKPGMSTTVFGTTQPVQKSRKYALSLR
jgi:hypothetical protein